MSNIDSPPPRDPADRTSTPVGVYDDATETTGDNTVGVYERPEKSGASAMSPMMMGLLLLVLAVLAYFVLTAIF